MIRLVSTRRAVLAGLALGATAAAFAVQARSDEMPGKGFRYGYVDVGGYHIQYAEAGPAGAPVIVSLPGSAGLEMSKAKDLLARRFRVIELQPPGWGDSPDLGHDVEQADQGKLLGEAANKLVNGRYHLIGTSMGGANALYLIANYPERVRSLTLEGGMAPTRIEDLKVPMIYREQVRKMLAGGGAPPAAPKAPGDGSAYPTTPVNPAKPWASAAYEQGQMAKRMRMMQWVQTDQGNPQLFAKVRAAHIPILAMVGDKDAILKTSVGEYWREVFPDARIVIVPGGEHDLQNTRPEILVREVLDVTSRAAK